MKRTCESGWISLSWYGVPVQNYILSMYIHRTHVHAPTSSIVMMIGSWQFDPESHLCTAAYLVDVIHP